MLETSDKYKTLIENGNYIWKLKMFIIPNTTAANKNIINFGYFETSMQEEGLNGYIDYKIVTFDEISDLTIKSNATDESRFSLGCVASKSLEFTLYNLANEWDNIRLNSAMIVPRVQMYKILKRYIIEGNATIEEDVEEFVEELQLGVFFASEATGDEDSITVHAYDAMCRFDKVVDVNPFKYFIETHPASQFYVSVLIEMIIEQSFFVVIPNKDNPTGGLFNNVILSADKMKGLILRALLAFTLELMYSRAYFNEEGYFTIKKFEAEEPVKRIEYEGMETYESIAEPVLIDGVSCKFEDIVIEKVSDNARYIIKLSDDNPVLYKRNETSMQSTINTIYNHISGIGYQPCNINLYDADPSLEAGDIITVADRNGAEAKVLISALVIKDNLTMEIIAGGESAESNAQTYQGGSSASNSYYADVDIASKIQTGIVQIGEGIQVDAAGVISIKLGKGLKFGENGAICLIESNPVFVGVGRYYNPNNTEYVSVIKASENGVNWSDVLQTFGNCTITDICYGDKFVAISSSGKASVSENGVDWSSLIDITTHTLNKICYGNGMYVAVSATGLFYSGNGYNWATYSTNVLGVTINNIFFNGNMFLLLGNQCRYMYSSNGVDWASGSVVNYSAYTNLMRACMAVGINYIYTNNWDVATSTDGISWNTNKDILRVDGKKEGTGNLLSEVAYGNNLFVGSYYSQSTNTYRIVTSVDGFSWETRKTIENGVIRGILYTGNTWFCMVRPNVIYTSKNGLLWNEILVGIGEFGEFFSIVNK